MKDNQTKNNKLAVVKATTKDSTGLGHTSLWFV